MQDLAKKLQKNAQFFRLKTKKKGFIVQKRFSGKIKKYQKTFQEIQRNPRKSGKSKRFQGSPLEKKVDHCRICFQTQT